MCASIKQGWTAPAQRIPWTQSPRGTQASRTAACPRSAARSGPAAAASRAPSPAAPVASAQQGSATGTPEHKGAVMPVKGSAGCSSPGRALFRLPRSLTKHAAPPLSRSASQSALRSARGAVWRGGESISGRVELEARGEGAQMAACLADTLLPVRKTPADAHTAASCT